MTETWLLHLQRDTWQLVPPGSEFTAFPPDDLAQQAQPIADALREAGHQGEPIVVGLGSGWCLTSTVPIPSPQLLRRREAMRYHLEQWIPWTAEDYVVDYVGHEQEAFMTAVRVQPLAELLNQLEECEVAVAIVCPTALLAASHYVATSDVPRDTLFLIEHETNVDLITVRNHQCYRWSHCFAAAEDIAREIRSVQLETTDILPVVGIGIGPELSEQLAKAGVKVTQDSEDLFSAAHTSATNILAGSQEPPVNLRRDELAGRRRIQRLGKEISRLQWAAALLLVLSTIGFWIRGNAYQAATDDARQRLVAVYERLFPSTEVPGDVAGAIESEYRNLQGTRAPEESIPTGSDTEVILERLLGALPKKMRFRLPEIHIEGQRVSLGGEVRTNSDADSIAVSLREHGFSVDAPKTQRLADKGFSVRLTGNAEKRK